MSPATEPVESPDDTLYVQNEEGTVVSVTRDHHDKYLTETTAAGRPFLLPGWKLLKEAEARKANPQLFGAPDPQITLTDDELIRAVTRQEQLAKLHAAAAPTE